MFLKIERLPLLSLSSFPAPPSHFLTFPLSPSPLNPRPSHSQPFESPTLGAAWGIRVGVGGAVLVQFNIRARSSVTPQRRPFSVLLLLPTRFIRFRCQAE